ncbi:MAG: tRNA 4-thiouridine(8) synthase ThiI [Deltaproteobacteria bacterium]|nr:tRNA 4-thiouridine(8) synthase ThiI [Deltaproteobacteria bacterium]
MLGFHSSFRLAAWRAPFFGSGPLRSVTLPALAAAILLWDRVAAGCWVRLAVCYGRPVNRIICRYHEVALKRGNRPLFVRQLINNIGRALRGTGVRRIKPAPGRIVVILGKDADWPVIQQRLSQVFGLANFALAQRTERNLEQLTDAILAAVKERTFASFAIHTKRADKSFPLPSPEINSIIGAAVQAQSGAAVNLSDPALLITAEILPREAFFSLEKLAGAGGLPVGTGGQLVTLLSGGIDSPVAAWRMMRRGCRLDFVHFHGAPFQDRASRDKAVELVRALTPYQFESSLHLVAFGEVQREIVTQVRRPYRVVLYRRMMMRIAAAIAQQAGAAALVTGESLGQVASQTLANLCVTAQATELPVLRPLIGMDKHEITQQAQAIGTYEISIQPDQDCCQLFVPRHPATRMSVAEAQAAEAALEVPALVQHALDRTEIVHIGEPAGGRHRPRNNADVEHQLLDGEAEPATPADAGVRGVDGGGDGCSDRGGVPG